jgi:protoporphyrinogen/coproporphyrinogen III oxidase
MTLSPDSARAHVVVVGGGIAGLATAFDLLVSGGVRVTLVEGSERLGGALRLAEVAGACVDVGAESLLATRPEATELVTRVGAGADLVTPATTSASVWTRGALHPLPRGTVMGVPADPESARGLLTDREVSRALAERAWPATELADDISVAEYVGARLGRAVVDRLVDPLLGGVYAGRADRLSLRATVPVLWERAARGESLLRSAVSGTGAADSGRAPFAGIRGGVGRLPVLVAEQVRDLGGTIRTGAVVRRLERTPSGWRLVIGSAAAPSALECDAVVVCVPAAAAARLLRPSAPTAARRLGDIETASTATVTLAVPRESGMTFPGSGFLVPPVEGRIIKAATFSATKWAWTGAMSPDVVHLRASLGRAGDEAALQRGDAELVAAAVADIGDILGMPAIRPVDAHVQRWGGGLPQYAVGHVDAVAAIRAEIERLPGLDVAGAAYDGVGVPAVVGSARRAASGIVRHIHRAGRFDTGPANVFANRREGAHSR